MTAIINDNLRRLLLQQIFDENEGVNLGDSDNHYYIAVGRAQQWQTEDNTDVTPDPQNTQRSEREFRYSMQSIKAAEGYSFVVPLTDWSANTIYSAYNDNVEGQPSQSYYVRTDDNNVYICIRQGKNQFGAPQVSQAKPDHTGLSLPIETDGYVWKYLYTILTADANKFLTTQFMPVKFVDSAAPVDPNFPQYAVQNGATAGQVVGYRVTEKGGVYSSAPTLTVVGDGTGAQARAILNATGAIESVEVGDSADANVLTNMGSGYTQASVTVSSATLAAGGTPAEIIPIFGPPGGLGADARRDLRSTSMMWNIKPAGTEQDTWVVDQGYRQIGLLRNPLIYDSADKFNDTQGVVLYQMKLQTPAGDGDRDNGYAIGFTNDVKITGSTSGAVAWLDWFDDSSTMWWHQDDITGFASFQNGENVTVDGYSASTLTTDSASVPGAIDKFSGDLLFINNFAQVTRDEAQTEDIKLVITL